MNGPVPVWIVKIGGSILRDAGAADRVSRWVSGRREVALVFIAGGGELADRVRAMDAAVGLGDRVAHQMAIQAMRANLQQLAGWWPARPVLQSIPHESLSAGVWLFDVGPWLARQADVPATWDFTSDSIAALLGICWPADRVVLLKSCPARQADAATLAAEGVVDPWFARLAPRLRCWHLDVPDAGE